MNLKTRICNFLKKSLKMQLNLFMCCMVPDNNKRKPSN